MTTNAHSNSVRDKHPARSARILTTGISIASVLGLTSAYSLAAPQRPLVPSAETIAPLGGVTQSATPLVGQPAIAPTQPAPATASTQSAPAIQIVQAAAPITIMVLQPNLPATRSSGSK